jgi:hypothetical protein
MGLFKKKPDPISDRARALNEEIAALEAKIEKLNTELDTKQPQLRVRSTALPHVSAPPNAPEPKRPASPPEPIFEDIHQQRLTPDPEAATTAAHYNELGVRKYDILALLRRWKNHLRGEPPANPKLVSYLAAGSIQGLRPLRYERRVARNRFVFLAIILLLMLWGIIAVIIRQR